MAGSLTSSPWKQMPDEEQQRSSSPETAHLSKRGDDPAATPHRPIEINQGSPLDEFTFVRVPARTFGNESDDDDAYSDDVEHCSDDEGPTLFIDSGNNKDSPVQTAQHAGKPMILAAASGGSVGGTSFDESVLGASGDFDGGPLSNGGRRSSGASRQVSLAAMNSRGGGGQAQAEASEGLLKVPEEEGPLLANHDLLSLPSLDITGDGGGRELDE